MRWSISLAVGFFMSSLQLSMAASYDVSAYRLFGSDGSDSSPVEVQPFDNTLGNLRDVSYAISGTIFPFSEGDEFFLPYGAIPDGGYPPFITGSVDGEVRLDTASESLSERIIVPLASDPTLGIYSLGIWPNGGGIQFGSSGSIPVPEYDSQVQFGGGLFLSGWGYFQPDLAIVCDCYIDPTIMLATAVVTYTYDVPEPPAVAVLGLGVLGLAIRRRGFGCDSRRPR